MTDFSKMREVALDSWGGLYSSNEPIILVGNATCGRSAGSIQVQETFEKLSIAHDIPCQIIEVGCIGLCFMEPIVCIIEPNQPAVFFGNITPERVGDLFNSYIIGGYIIEDLVIGTTGDVALEGISEIFDLPILKPQVRRVLKRCGFIDPTNLEHYLANDGYSGFQKALGEGPEFVIDQVKHSQLRGRGGAGFPTWKKWRFCRDAEADTKYLICNADEGDPGAFMNRSLIEGDPHALIEGMIISGFALGASTGYIYCRAEYPLALERLRLAIHQAKESGLLGENILNSGFNFEIQIKEGAGAFVCGEETALIRSIEGKRGMPTPRPPFPAVSGLWGKPTIINNVETLACISLILQNGSDWFAEYGTEDSKGTKTISLVGKVNNSGLTEVPLGISLRELVFEIGGGIPNDKPFKAVQTGGPSGGCIPEHLLDTPVDYDALNKVGTIMGSGGVVVMDNDTCMVDFARYFLTFAEDESCGKCVPCRLGTKQMLSILEDIVAGRGKPEDLDLLEELSAEIKKGSLCGLGQTAPNPVQTTLQYFRNEYEAHIFQKSCPAKKCKELITFHILDSCVGCGKCLRNCSSNAIQGKPKELHWIDQSLCHKCGVCYEVCPPKVFSVEVRTG